MRASIAYFAGAGTVVAAIAVGLGGGLTIANIISPHVDKGIEVSRLERRMSSEPAANPSPSATQAPYVATTQPVTVSPAPAPTPAPVQAEAAKPAPSPSPSAEPSVATATIAKPKDPPAPQRAAAAPPPPPIPAAPPVVREQVAKSDDAMAKAHDADVKRAERRSERRQQWADRRRPDPRGIEQRQGQELVDVEQKVREETEPPPHEFPPGPRMDFPQIKLFGPD